MTTPEPTATDGNLSSELFAGHPAAFALVVSGPSGVGKTSICQDLIARDGRVSHVVTTTTRDRRPGETDGVDYHFLSEAAFAEQLAAGAFVEHAVVHGRNYGTTRSAFAAALERADVVLLEVDVQGAKTWREVLGDRAVTVFILPPSLDELRRRLKGRKSEGEEALKVRTENARREMAHAPAYDYVIVNHDLEQAVGDVMGVVQTERSRPSRQGALLESLKI